MIESVKPRRFVIALVDDDTRILDSLDELLASAGYDVLLFSSAGDFVAASGFQLADCLISDICMPTMTGWNLLQIAQAEHTGFPVILISGREEELSRTSRGRAASGYFFGKPFDGPELLAALEAILTAGKAPERM